MTVDIYGKHPTNEGGKYFGRNVWWWRPLVEFVCDTCPTVAARCSGWFENSGDGLGSDDAVELADLLDAAVADGTAAHYVSARNAHLQGLPDERCIYCRGTGVRDDAVGAKAGFPEKPINNPDHHRFGQKGWCNGCDGLGTVRPFVTSYHLAVEDVTEFAAFARDSGGFEIW